MQTSTELCYVNESILYYPSNVSDLTDKMLVVGDLHGNAMKIFYILLRYGVLSLDEPQLFQEAWSIYNKATDELTSADLSRFEAIVNGARVKLPGLLNFIGDEAADRGKNDFFTALIFEKLHTSQVPYHIQLSNHGVFLLAYLEKGYNCLPPFNPGQAQSLDNYIALSQRIVGLDEKFKQLTEHAYKDHLSLIGYAEPDGAGLCLLTHAPIRERTLADLAASYSVAYDDSSKASLIQCIDQINQQVKEQIVANQFHKTLTSFNFRPGYPIYDILWNRTIPINERLPCQALNIHGHVGAYKPGTPINEAYINLDSDWGKPEETVIHYGQTYFFPADDKTPAPMFFTDISTNDRLSQYFKSAAYVPLLVNEDEGVTVVEDLSSSSSGDEEAKKNKNKFFHESDNESVKKMKTEEDSTSLDENLQTKIKT